MILTDAESEKGASMDNFTSFEYVMSFAGMIATVIMLTQFTKSIIDKIMENKTKYVVLGFATLLCVIAAVFFGDFTSFANVLKTVLVWIVNDVIVWMAAMKAFEVIKGE